MPNETDKLIEEQVKTLSPNLQRAINIVPWKSLLQEIGMASTLNLEQIASLEQETMFIIYGLENPNDYISNIIREMSLSKEIAYRIAESVANKIFEPILKRSDELEKEKLQTPPVVPLPTPINPPNNPPVVEPAFAQGSIMIKKGEVVHSVPHVEQPKPEPAKQPVVIPPPTPTPPPIKTEKVVLPAPDYRYPGGKDPYREPLG